jgi:hypothetical protein
MRSNGNSGFFAELFSPDTSRIGLTIEVSDYSFCDIELTASPVGGEGPFEYAWNEEDFSANNIFRGPCANDTVSCIIRDSRGCRDTLTYIVQPQGISGGNIYPNPTKDLVSIQFELATEQTVRLEI